MHNMISVSDAGCATQHIMHYGSVKAWKKSWFCTYQVA